MGYYILASKSNSFHKKLYLLLNILGWIIKKPQKVNRKKPFFSASYFAFTIFWFSHRYNTRDRKSSSGNARDRFLWLQLTFTEMTPVVPDCRWLKSDHGKESQLCFLELLLAQLSNIMIFLKDFLYIREWKYINKQIISIPSHIAVIFFYENVSPIFFKCQSHLTFFQINGVIDKKLQIASAVIC